LWARALSWDDNKNESLEIHKSNLLSYTEYKLMKAKKASIPYAHFTSTITVENTGLKM
jgi:hypothetical protein